MAKIEFRGKKSLSDYHPTLDVLLKETSLIPKQTLRSNSRSVIDFYIISDFNRFLFRFFMILSIFTNHCSMGVHILSVFTVFRCSVVSIFPVFTSLYGRPCQPAAARRAGRPRWVRAWIHAPAHPACMDPCTGLWSPPFFPIRSRQDRN